MCNFFLQNRQASSAESEAPAQPCLERTEEKKCVEYGRHTGAAAGAEEPARRRACKKEKEESPWNVTVPGGPPGPRSNVIGESGEGGERSGPRLRSCD